jgi:hypothetical protein
MTVQSVPGAFFDLSQCRRSPLRLRVAVTRMFHPGPAAAVEMQVYSTSNGEDKTRNEARPCVAVRLAAAQIA